MLILVQYNTVVDIALRRIMIILLLYVLHIQIILYYTALHCKDMMVTKLRNIGANVIVYGKNWNEADSLAREALAKEQGAYYIPPYGACVSECRRVCVCILVCASIV